MSPPLGREEVGENGLKQFRGRENIRYECFCESRGEGGWVPEAATASSRGQETLSLLSWWYVSESLLAYMMGTQMLWAVQSP